MTPAGREAAAAVAVEWPTADGRSERSRRTHERLVQAVIELVEDGDYRPTAQSVVDRAGVALRTLYHHFDDVEALRITAFRLVWQRFAAALVPLDATLPVEQRIKSVVRQLGKLHEAITPICRAEQLAGELATQADSARPARRILRDHLARTFAPEIAGAGIASEVLLDALDTALSWDSWDCLRADLGRSATSARTTFELVLRNLFSSTTIGTKGEAEIVRSS